MWKTLPHMSIRMPLNFSHTVQVPFGLRLYITDVVHCCFICRFAVLPRAWPVSFWVLLLESSYLSWRVLHSSAAWVWWCYPVVCFFIFFFSFKMCFDSGFLQLWLFWCWGAGYVAWINQLCLKDLDLYGWTSESLSISLSTEICLYSSGPNFATRTVLFFHNIACQ